MSNVKDVYDLNLKNSSFLDKLSDRFFGTNNVNNINTSNNYELQKAVNLNKYQWNVEGMKAAGINPIANSGNLSNVSASQANSNQNGDLGVFGNELVSLFKQFAPSNQIKETKELIKEVLKSK